MEDSVPSSRYSAGVCECTPPAHRILVVEDDPASSSFIECTLSRTGYEVAVASDADDAEAQLRAAEFGSFQCVVCDYRLPNRDGLELLAWIKSWDPALSTIIVTAEGERGLIKQSLRGGAADFLDKPLNIRKLRASVQRAIEQTGRQRQLADSASAIRQLGRAQERMLDMEMHDTALRVDVCFHPKHEAGGDFFSRFQPNPQQLACLLTDVSGHDAQAAFISAYFQGIVRGMIECATPIEQIFALANEHLRKGWNRGELFETASSGIQASVAACAVLIDSDARTATIWSHGTPAPVFWQADGNAQTMGQGGGFALGWFPHLDGNGVVQPLVEGGSFCLWTDGLQDVADRKGVSELSLAFALQRAKAGNEKPLAIEGATDDILLADIHLLDEPSLEADFRPLMLEHYHGGQTGEIDFMQAFWARSLAVAVPELPESKMHDVLLASREAVLNALRHGCESRCNATAKFQAAYSESSQILRVRISDPGRGHDFDFGNCQIPPGHELSDGHRGLILIQHLANRLEKQRGGATLIMDFAAR